MYWNLWIKIKWKHGWNSQRSLKLAYEFVKIKMMTIITNDPAKHFYLEIELFLSILTFKYCLSFIIVFLNMFIKFFQFI